MSTKSSKSGTHASAVSSFANRPEVKWQVEPNLIVKATQELIMRNKGPMSVEKLISGLDKEFKIKIPGEGLPVQRMILNSLLRLVSSEAGGVVVRRRAGVDLPEHAERDFQLRAALAAKGLSEDQINEVIEELGTTTVGQGSGKGSTKAA